MEFAFSAEYFPQKLHGCLCVADDHARRNGVVARRRSDAHASFLPDQRATADQLEVCMRRNVSGPDVRSAVKHRPADIIPQPLVVKNEPANRIRQLVTLPSALASPCGLGFAVRRVSTRGLNRIGGRGAVL
jgi:hypothetical protein